jgi:hypothetical protein
MRWTALWGEAGSEIGRKDSAQEAPAYNPEDEPAPLGDVYRRGEAAHRLLNDPTLAEAFRDLREDLYAEWMATDPKQAERREELYYEAHALHRVTSKLIAYRGAARIRADTERAA